jgi:hypothetical protein
MAYGVARRGPRHTVRSLGTAAGKVTKVELLGCKEQVDWQQTDAGLVVNLPPQRPCAFAYGLKVTGENLKAAPNKLK